MNDSNVPATQTSQRYLRGRSRPLLAPGSPSTAMRARCASAWTTSAMPGSASSPRPTPSGGGSSATCTTALSSGWSPSPLTLGLAEAQFAADPEKRLKADRPGPR